MSATFVHTTTNHDATAVAPTEPSADARRGPIWRIVGGSVAAGLLGALALTLGVFGGATEPVISGTALLAFAAGWGLLALLSTRCTTQPQTWARVPAVAMASAGTALLVARPDDRTLDAAGWVWPVGAIALCVWMVVQLRRALRSRARWLLYPVIAAVALGSIGAAYETVTRAGAQDDHPAPGTLYDVGGRRLHIDCAGAGSPTVVFQNGLGGLSVSWSRITQQVSRTTRVCVYDRAGQGWSDDVDGPQDGIAIADDLHVVLGRAGETGPYVLVGHSAGGPYSMVYADRYPDEVAGMVLLDSMSPDAFTDLPGFATQQSMMRRGLGVLPSLTRLGAGRLLPTSAWSSLPEPAASQVQSLAASSRGMRSMRDEQSMYPEVFAQARELASLDAKPLVVLIATESIGEHDEWVELQERLADLSTDGQHRVVDATHAGLVDHATSSTASVRAIGDVVHSIRTGQPVAFR
jgi:pimeloyl-ACP methyl ester carboxylesterase